MVPVAEKHHEHFQSLRPETRVCSGHLRRRVPWQRHGAEWRHSQRATSRLFVCFFVNTTSRRSSSCRSGAYPAAVVSYVTAAIGSPVESGGVTAWFHVKQRLLVDQVHVAPVSGGNGETFPKLVTHLFIPANDATLSGTTLLDAAATSYFG